MRLAHPGVPQVRFDVPRAAVFMTSGLLMTVRLPSHKVLLPFAEAMLIAAAGGAVFQFAGFPAGWMAGSLVFVAFASLAGRNLHVPTFAARCFFIALGMIIGGVATPETVRGIATWPLSIVLICLAMLTVTVAAAAYLRLVHGWDTQTALFAAVPGSLSQVSAMAAERQADLKAIIIVQSLRVMALAVGVPLSLAIAGMEAPMRFASGGQSALDAPGHLALLVAGSIVAAVALYRIGFTGGFFFGPMVVSAFLHGSGTIEVNLPGWIAVLSMIALGAINGSRFNQTSFRMLAQYLVASLGSLVVVVSVAGIFVLFAAAVFSLRMEDLIASYAPGSVDVMMILALALHLDPVFVGAHHLARILIVSLALPVGARLTDHRPLQHHELPASLEAARETLED